MKVTDFDIVGRIDANSNMVPKLGQSVRDFRDVYRCSQCRALIMGSDIPIDPKNDLVLHVKWHTELNADVARANDPRSAPGWSDGH